MPSFRDSLLQAVDRARTFGGSLGLRQYTVTVRLEQYVGSIAYNVATTAPAITDLVLSPAPGVKRLSEREAEWFGGGNLITDASGRLISSLFKIGPITPAYSTPGNVFQTGTGTGTITPRSALTSSGIAQGNAGSYTIVIQITTSGGVGVGQAAFSSDGGQTFGAPSTIVATASTPFGCAMDFAGTFNVGDTYSFTLSCGGYTPQQLMPKPSNDSQRSIYLMTGPDLATAGETFELAPGNALVLSHGSPSFRYELVVTRVAILP